eukprot:SAG11_NODE_32235_length_285_cov_0.983871_2_plen_52_part_01
MEAGCTLSDVRRLITEQLDAPPEQYVFLRLRGGGAAPAPVGKRQEGAMAAKR